MPREVGLPVISTFSIRMSAFAVAPLKVMPPEPSAMVVLRMTTLPPTGIVIVSLFAIAHESISTSSNAFDTVSAPVKVCPTWEYAAAAAHDTRRAGSNTRALVYITFFKERVSVLKAF
jgi:hypothetical protein